MNPFPSTLLDAFLRRCEQDAGELRFFHRPSAAFEGISGQRFANDVAHAAAALARYVTAGDRIAQYADNSYQWIVLDMACHALGCVHVAIHGVLTGKQTAYQVSHSGAKVLLVSGESLHRKLASAVGELPQDIRLISGGGQSRTTVEGRPLIHWQDLLAETNPQTGRELWETTKRSLNTNDVATILYTSGTTGEPKGVMLSHGNLISNAHATIIAYGYTPEDRKLSWLPLSHIYARTCDLYVWLIGGGEMYLALSRESVLEDLQTAQPTTMSGVPYFYDRVARTLQEKGAANDPANLHKVFGGRVRHLGCGGAALPAETFRFYHERQLMLLPGYGLTEASPVVSVSGPNRFKEGWSGRPISGIEIKLGSDGELLTRGPHVMLGYYRDETATRTVIQDGWLHTGDLAEIDADGFLRITGRKKEIIVTSAGKNVSPALLEGLLAQELLIAQVMVVGDDRKYLGALIVPNAAEIAKLAAQKNWVVDVNDCTSLNSHAELCGEIQRRIKDRLRDLAPYEQIGRFVFIHRPFSLEQGEVTAKLSLKRDVIARNFAAEINDMYRD